MKLNFFLLIFLPILIFIAISCYPREPFFNQKGIFADQTKEIFISLQLRKNGRGSILMEIHPSYESLKKGIKIPRTVEKFDVSWVQDNDQKKISYLTKEIMADVYKDKEGFFVIRFNKIPYVMLKREYKLVPKEYRLVTMPRPFK